MNHETAQRSRYLQQNYHYSINCTQMITIPRPHLFVDSQGEDFKFAYDEGRAALKGIARSIESDCRKEMN